MRHKRYVLTLALAVLAGVVMSTGGVGAADNDVTPPVIRHEAVSTAYSDANLILKANVADETALSRVTLFFRSKGTTNYYALDMNVVLGQYRAAIPATYMQPGVIQYYIQATDAAGNVTTWPAVGAARNPQNISVVKDTTTPQAEVVLPRGGTSTSGYVAIIALNDQAGNIDPGTLRVVVNGQDLTKDAQVTATRVMFTVPAEMVQMRSTLEVEISDLAGNRLVRRFGLWEAADWSRELRIDMEAGEGLLSNFDTAFSWGPLDLSASVRSDDPVFTSVPGQPTSTYSLKYDARLMTLAVGDISSTASPLTMSSMNHRGADLTLRLGPLSAQGVYGFPQVYVPEEDFQRKVIGFRPAFDTRFLDFSLNLTKVRDEWAPALEDEITSIDPELNYVVDTQLGVGMFDDKLSLLLELAGSVYFPNARGDLWASIDALKADYDNLSDIEKTIVDYADKVPTALRGYLELPDITRGPVRADVGGQAILKVPLPWSSLSARAYHFGRDYYTIYGAGDKDAEGYKAEFTTLRWFNLLEMGATYEQRRNNAVALLDYVLKSPPLTQSFTNTYQARLSLGPAGRFNIDLTGDYIDQGEDGAATLASITRSYTAACKNLRFGVFGLNFRLGGLYGLMESLKPVDYTPDKTTLTYKADAGMDIGVLSFDLNYTLKQEQDAAGTVSATSPTLDGAVTLQLRQPRLLFIRLNDVRLNAGASQSYTLVAGTKYDEMTTLKAEMDTRLTAGFRIGAIWKTVLKAGVDPDTTVTGQVRWRF